MASSGGQVQLTKKVLKEFVREQCRDVGQVRRTRPKTLALQEQASLRGELVEAESPPLLLSPGPRSHAQSDPQEPLSQSDTAQARDDEDKVVADVVRRLKVLATKLETKSAQGEPSPPMDLIRTLLYAPDLRLSWERVAELFTAMFNMVRSLAEQDPEQILAQLQETVDAVVSTVSNWVIQNGGWWNFLTLFSSNSSSRCDSPIVDHTSTDHQLASAQTDGEGTVAAAAASVGNVVRSRDASGAPQFPRAKKVPSHTTPLEKVKSCIELTHRPPGSPVHPRGRPCSAPMSHCPVMFAMGFARELFDIARKSIWDENVPPSPDSKD